MATKDTITISVTLRNGQCFKHQHPKKPQPELLEFIHEIVSELAKPRRGILTLPSPLGIYRMDDISSIHFPDMIPSADTPRMGYLKSLEGINKGKD